MAIGASLAPLLAVLFLFASLLSFVRSRQRANLFDQQSGIESITKLSWQQFEQLIGEYYRRQGYRIEETGQGGADGGVDLRLWRDGQLTLVQCKHWRSWKVGVGVVREMLGLVVSHGAVSGIVVASGIFTADAHRFARDNGIELLNGNRLNEAFSKIRGSEFIQKPGFGFESLGVILSRLSPKLMMRNYLFIKVLSLMGFVALGGMAMFFISYTISNLQFTSIKPSDNAALPPVTPEPARESAAWGSSESIPQSGEGGIYHWRDADGQMVYGDLPPRNVDAVRIRGRLQDANIIQSYKSTTPR